ncbi:hypothetical protein N7509_009981 [Penicillium cosmopolitanum]|uniref:Uncharacterized protein n=1 Tax=Penicillium cosmopolitanum TaxID=1131564 RepID=A0A9X0B465_9EURO|nr:uncharacterized protein N7509_009981 [Penicillium cosmopolitanum]KAJ5387440.1 hypothetical protein N7509_009981 [Penicillium cosmopolitanum]
MPPQLATEHKSIKSADMMKLAHPDSQKPWRSWPNGPSIGRNEVNGEKGKKVLEGFIKADN